MQFAQGRKLRAKSDLDRLNELIDWYEKFGKPTAGKVILVKFSERQLNKFAKHVHGTSRWHYRDRTLLRIPPGGQHAKTETETRPQSTNTEADPGTPAGG